jgi:hypothetical protein
MFAVALVTAALAAVFMAPVLLAGQGRSATREAAKTWTVPRTPDGHPDLQGFWTNATFTPLERPDGVTKEFYSPEEAADREKREGARLAGQAEAPATPGEWLAAGPGAVPRPGTVADVHYDFSQFGLDRSQSALARTLRTALIVDPPDGKIPPLTSQGRQLAAARAKAREQLGGRWDSAQSNELDDRCIIMGGGPPMLPQPYNSNYQIVQGADHVMVLVEMLHDARVIPLDSRPQVSRNIRQWMGSSRGRWEGETLVVETTNFTDKTAFRGSGEHLRVVERFTRIAEDTLLYRFTLDDPTTWTRPWTAEIPMQKTIGPIFEFACHEGNYGLYNSLSGARAEEKKAAAEAAKQLK